MKNNILIIFILFILSYNSYAADTKVIILGFDGMDPEITNQMLEKGLLPNLKKLKNMGYYSKLQTSNPPQSPVAWSNFTTGMNPGKHNIFDFIKRNPETYMPEFAMSKIVEGDKINIFGKEFSITPDKPVNLRKGKAFWEVLEENDVTSTIFKIPANYSPVGTESKTLSGMGTPDILGTYGIYSYYTNSEDTKLDKIKEGGNLKQIEINNNVIETEIDGPDNLSIPMKIYLDKYNNIILINVQNQEFLFKKGELSDWVTLNFNGISAICKFYLKSVRPEFKLYLSPLNIDPRDPVSPISTSEDYLEDIVEHTDLFFTQGMPEETKGLSAGALSYSDYLKQAMFILKNRINIFDYHLNNFDDDVLFYYFSSSDLNMHMLYRFIDKENIFYNDKDHKKYFEYIKLIYQSLDKVVGKVLDYAEEHENLYIFVMSDHGFAPFTKKFHLNNWLRNQGYLKLEDNEQETEFFQDVDWSQTKAYGIGFNGLYLNLKDRESYGIVSEYEKNRLLNEIKNKLLQIKDNGKQVIKNVYLSQDIYKGDYATEAPDIIIGYNRGYRISDESALGTVTGEKVLEYNKSEWSGDHCMDYTVVPGIIFCNKKVVKPNPSLLDFFPTILKLYNIKVDEDIDGKPLF